MYTRKELYKNKKQTKTHKVKHVLADGTVRTYEYYDNPKVGYGSRGIQKLATASGKRTKAYDKLVKEIKQTYSEQDAEKIIEDLNRHIERSVLLHSKGEGAIYQASTYRSRLVGLRRSGDTLIWGYGKLERYLYNMGADIDQLQEKVGVSRDELLDETNWKFDESGEITFTRLADQKAFLLYVAYESGVVKWKAQ